MSVLEYLAKVDFAAVQFERAKREMEAAKMNFEKTKLAYDEILTQAESMGLSKPKLKRVAEERIVSLLESGLIDMGKEIVKKSADAKAEKVAKSKKKNRAADSDESSREFDGSSDDYALILNDSIEGNA